MRDHHDPHDIPSFDSFGEGSPGPAFDPSDPSDLGVVPLFPLPNFVIFPRAVHPLHIFEERYKAMTRHALEGDRRIAMALLRPGWEKSYYGRPAIEPVVCVGTILTHERLDDGKYNFLLQGTARARIVKEVGNEPYRLARLQRLPEVEADEPALAEFRRRMVESFAFGPLSETVAGRQFGRLLRTPLSTPDLADLIAFSLLDGVELKQSLLADVDVRRRVGRALEALDAVRPPPGAEPAAQPAPTSASVRAFRRPGMN